MAASPLLSVVIPVYNGEGFIRRCVESLLAQDVGDMEIVVVDDGSRDGTWALLEQLAREDDRVRPFRQANGGVSAARNTALAHIRGHYVRFADADDVAVPGSTRALIDRLESSGSSLVIGGYNEITGPLRTPRSLAPDRNWLDLEDFLQVFSRQSNSFYYGVLWNKLFLGDIIRRHQLRFPQDMKLGEDFHFVTDYLRHVRRVAYLPQPVYNYCRRMGGAVVQQFFSSILHPLRCIKTRLAMYANYRSLYVQLGYYPRYRRTLWLFLFRFTLRN